MLRLLPFISLRKLVRKLLDVDADVDVDEVDDSEEMVQDGDVDVNVFDKLLVNLSSFSFEILFASI